MGQARSLTLIVKQAAAGDPALREAVTTLRDRGHRIAVRVTWEAGDTQRFTTAAIADGADVIVAGGGDGTINEVVNTIHEAGALGRCAVAVLPCGTANDFATACGIPPDDPMAALELAAEVAPSQIDVGHMNGRLFVNVASGGYGAEVTAQTQPGAKKILGGLAYFLTGLTNLGNLTAHPTRAVGPDFLWEGEMVGFAVGNGQQAGGGFKVAPGALLNDGLLDVTLIPRVELQELGALARDLLDTTPNDDTNQHLITCQVPWLELEVVEKIYVNLDGEPVQSASFRFDVFEEKLSFCLPPSAPLKP